MPPPIAVLDANVLYPAPMRDFLLQLAYDGFFKPKWSDQIQEEWARNLLANRSDLTPANIAYTRSNMQAAFPAACVTGYEYLISQLTNHPDDRHVLAVAIHAQAPYVITRNLKDFKPTDLAPHGVQAVHPDDFTFRLYQEATTDMVDTIRGHRARLKRPPKTAQEYIDDLAHNDLLQIAAALQKHVDEL